MKTIGQIAYEAYAGTTGWKSAISGAPLPQWEAQAQLVREAWEAAAAAARSYPVTMHWNVGHHHKDERHVSDD